MPRGPVIGRCACTSCETEPDMFETKWTIRLGRPSRGDLRQLAALAEANRAELFAEWQQKVNVKTPGGKR